MNENFKKDQKLSMREKLVKLKLNLQFRKDIIFKFVFKTINGISIFDLTIKFVPYCWLDTL